MVNRSNRGQVNKEVLRGPQDEGFEGLRTNDSKDFAIVLGVARTKGVL